MKKFKILITVVLLLCMTIFSGCSGQKHMHEADGKLKVSATVFPLYDFARHIAGDKADVTLLLPCGSEVHSYEPTPKDIITIQESDLFVTIGGETDIWKDAFESNMYGREAKMLETLDYVEADEHIHHGELEIDEHIWTSVENSINISEAICLRLCAADTENENYYRKNCEKLKDELKSLDKSFKDTVEHSKRRVLIFADRFPFKYFAEEYGLEYFAAFPGCSSESEPSAATVSSLIERVKKESVPAVLYTETSNEKTADVICEETGAEKLLFHSCHTVTKEQLAKNITYTDIMKGNLKVLKKVLN